ncbi:uncharacterized protein N7459_001893 [Penicillium hispanicum]|uniref:uncharacterized protein n=1 Tax=Penicillium hispanicum TaxID=1080232 RepID=UPI002540AB5F|nr:uncharacterized protein N7459_001893 [Penicillium hispanicum]KAJ5591524.1 hypothetical protein N7459_001893 [Penicillium hispanicum]
MEESDEIQQANEVFFALRKSPTRAKCDEIALSMLQGVSVRCVDTPGTMSYTVIVTNAYGRQDVVSFRDEGSGLYAKAIPLARAIYNELVPEPKCHDIVPGSGPPLFIYTMPYMRGVAASKVLCTQADMTPEDEAKHTRYVRDLARYVAIEWLAKHGGLIPMSRLTLLLLRHRYFGRGWNLAMTHDCSQSKRKLRQTRKVLRIRVRKLLNKKRYPNSVPRATADQLEAHVERLFDGYEQVVTHGDLVPNNILVDEETFAITGIVDWSLATVHPFGMDLYAMFLAMGYADESGWHYYTCRPRLQSAFWEEFFMVTEVQPSARQAFLRKVEAAAALGAALRFAFQRNTDGSASPNEEKSVYLKGWYGEFYGIEQVNDGSQGAREGLIERSLRKLLGG